MSTITRFTNEQLIEKAKEYEEFFRERLDLLPQSQPMALSLRLAEIALASLDAKARKVFTCAGCGAEGLDEPLESRCHCGEDGAQWVESVVYTAPPAPVSVPDDLAKAFISAIEKEQDRLFGEDYLMDSKDCVDVIREEAQRWNACRAAMLQGSDQQQSVQPNIPEIIPATQFNPVADLYALCWQPDEVVTYTTEPEKAAIWLNNYTGTFVQEYVELERLQEALVGRSPVMLDEKGASLQLRTLIRQRHAEWSDKTFGNVGPVGPLKHLSKEALEAAAEPDDLSEWADMQFLLWDAQRRAGISDGEITAAMEEKLKVNMARQWPEPKDGEPRLHIKDVG